MHYIEKTGLVDYFRFVPGVRRLLPMIKLTFSEPIKISKYDKLEPKEIAKKLESDYGEWLNKLA